MKRFCVMLVVIVMLAAAVLPVSAASGISAKEQAVLDAVSASFIHEQTGQTVKLPSAYVDMVRNVLIDKDVTDAQCDKLVGYINEALDAAKKLPYNAYRDIEINNTYTQQVITVLKNAGAVIGGTITVSLDESRKIRFIPKISFPDGTSYTLVADGTGNKVIKATGASSETWSFLIAGGVLLAAVGFVVFGSHKVSVRQK